MIAAILLASATWGPWRDVRAIGPTPAQHAQLRSITIAPSVFNDAQATLADLRIVDDRGTEVPFAMVERAPSGEVWRDAGLTDSGFVASRYSQAVADAGPDIRDRYGLEIDTPRAGFSARVRVEASDDRRTWRVIRSGAPIYDFQPDGLGGNFRVSFPASDARWYRVQIQDTQPTEISGIRLLETSQRTGELTRYDALTTKHVRRANGDTVVVLDTRINHLPVSMIRIGASTANFSREVTVSDSADGTTWSEDATQTLVRIAGRRNDVSLPFEQRQARYWRIAVHDNNDAPLAALRISLWGVPRHAVFESQPNRRYLLLSHNPQAAAPVYDFAQVHTAQQLEAAPAIALQPAVINPNYAPAVAMQPWTEQHRWLLWIILGCAIIAIGALALRTISPGPTED